MRYSRQDLLQLKDGHLYLDEDIIFEKKAFENIRRLNDLKDVHVTVDGYFQPETSHLDVNIKVSGTMNCPCDITGEDVLIDFNSEADETFSFNKNETDVEIIKSNGDYIELLPTIFGQILLEIPLTVLKKGKIDYPSGDGWAVMTEEMAEKQRSERKDPRWAKLSEYIPQDDKEV